MTGRAEVERQRQRLEATIARADSQHVEPEVMSDLARYLCILIAGFLEQAIIELLMEYARLHSHTTIQRHVEQRLRRLGNVKAQKLIQLMGSFDPKWRADLEKYLVDEYRDSVDSVVDLRNTVAHGRYAGITIARVREYYARVSNVVAHVADLCLP